MKGPVTETEMTLIDDILNSHSVSVVGLEKNTGKTECLNYIIRNLPLDRVTVAVTSIGVDGECVDAVTATHKPEILIREGMLFSTSEKHYRQRRIFSELIDISDEHTALGRVVTAKALDSGKVLLSGPSSGVGLERWIRRMDSFGVGLKLVDGAISRMSSASPSISEAIVLSTGAAFSCNMHDLVRKTVHVVEMIMLEPVDESMCDKLSILAGGIWKVSKEDGALEQIPGVESALSLSGISESLVRGASALYVSGAVTDRIVDRIVSDGASDGFMLVARDFTRLFVSPLKYQALKARGIRLGVLQSSRLLAVCVNPVSPNGIVLDSDRLCQMLEQNVPVPVYDLFKI